MGSRQSEARLSAVGVYFLHEACQYHALIASELQNHRVYLDPIGSECDLSSLRLERGAFDGMCSTHSERHAATSLAGFSPLSSLPSELGITRDAFFSGDWAAKETPKMESPLLSCLSPWITLSKQQQGLHRVMAVFSPAEQVDYYEYLYVVVWPQLIRPSSAIVPNSCGWSCDIRVSTCTTRNVCTRTYKTRDRQRERRRKKRR
jgi:hypothetical protein